jgi:hypothetical protein
MQGRIQVRTRAQFKPALSADDNSSKGSSGHKSGAGSAGSAAEDSSSAAEASEADLRALFNSIDVDGSGGLWALQQSVVA